MSREESGFTLIELMITIAIVGILAAIAIPTFIAYMNQGKQVESRLAIGELMKRVRLYHLEHHALPPSAPLFPATTACASPTGKIPAQPQSAWYADPGWRTLGFAIVDESRYQYEWELLSPTEGQARAIGDSDCDGVSSMHVVAVDVLAGNVIVETTAVIED